jgi:hypothetical protein
MDHRTALHLWEGELQQKAGKMAGSLSPATPIVDEQFHCSIIQAVFRMREARISQICDHRGFPPVHRCPRWFDRSSHSLSAPLLLHHTGLGFRIDNTGGCRLFEGDAHISLNFVSAKFTINAFRVTFISDGLMGR